MSLGLAALQGGMGAEGAAKGFRGMKDTMVNQERQICQLCWVKQDIIN